MKIQIASDLHLNLLQERFPGFRAVEPAADAEVLVIAGDIHHGTGAVDLFSDWPVPVVYVQGNHEAYGAALDETVQSLRAAAGGNVHYLENDVVVFNGVRFLGCCLWTDYQLFPDKQQAAMQECEARLLDHRAIRMANGLFTAEDARQLHLASRAWLAAKLDETFDGPTVVVTHHSPHPGSIHPRYDGQLLNAGFISDLTPLLGKSALWIHGHVHDSFDYTVNGTRVVTNPRGYALNRRAAATLEQIQWENPAFQPALLLEI
ncbi:metallophosphoesterase [Noviherbaspirillum sp. ST9]|uniref:metallophosphoesterase n=1 Tax=Noviherbaspirillum sp. ST9 TaxID=3401606 RepID=UPI003B58987C